MIKHSIHSNRFNHNKCILITYIILIHNLIYAWMKDPTPVGDFLNSEEQELYIWIVNRLVRQIVTPIWALALTYVYMHTTSYHQSTTHDHLSWFYGKSNRLIKVIIWELSSMKTCSWAILPQRPGIDPPFLPCIFTYGQVWKSYLDGEIGCVLYGERWLHYQ